MRRPDYDRDPLGWWDRHEWLTGGEQGRIEMPEPKPAQPEPDDDGEHGPSDWLRREEQLPMWEEGR